MGDSFLEKKNILRRREKSIRKINKFLSLIFGIMSLVLGIFFWSFRITGNAITDGRIESYGILGTTLLVGFILGFWNYVRMRR